MIVLLTSAERAESNGISRPEVSVGFRFLGAAMVQDDTKTKFLPTLVIGCEADLDALVMGNNRIGFGIGYLYHFQSQEAGTEQVNLISKRGQVDLTLNYRYYRRYFGIFAKIGASMGIISATMRIYDLGEPSLSANRDAYIFRDKTLVTEEKASGTIWGPTALVGGSLDLSSVFFRNRPEMDNFWFFDIAVQYALRDLKNEVAFFAATRITIRKIETKTK